MKPNCIVSSCGTSILTNYVRGRDQAQLRKVTDLSSVKGKALPSDDKEFLDRLFDEVTASWLGVDLAHAGERSAELNALIAFYGGNIPAGGPDQHYLLHSDTYVGEKSAALIQQWMTEQGMTTTLQAVDGLTVGDSWDFATGVSSLATFCEEVVEPLAGHYRVIFNLTGGFKAMQGVLNTLGMLYADELLYLFERAELIRVPRLPLVLDIAGIVGERLRVFRRLSRDLTEPPEAVAGIPEALVMRDAASAMLSVWGEVMWRKVYRQLYREALLEPPSDLIRYGERFGKSVEKIHGTDWMVHLNTRLDDLAVYLESDRRSLLNRLDVKPLRSNPKPPSTHEFDAYAEGGAPRVFFHYEGKVAVLDVFDDGLGH